MVTDQQVRRLFMLNKKVKSRSIAAAKAGMDPKTARKYLRNGKLPSQIKSRHGWKTRKDPFEKDWPAILEMLDINLGLEGKTIFEYLQNATPGQYQDNQLRTLGSARGVPGNRHSYRYRYLEEVHCSGWSILGHHKLGWMVNFGLAQPIIIIAQQGKFSSDHTILEYAREIRMRSKMPTLVSVNFTLFKLNLAKK